METYTIKELLNLHKAITAAEELLSKGLIDSPSGAVRNIAWIINEYQDKGPEKILEKIKEFADIGELPFSIDYYEINPHTLVYNLIYEEGLNDMPLYLNTPYEPIAIWRLSLPKI